MSVPLYKITLLGDGAVGKTALRNRFMGKDFASDYLMTIGADFATRVVEISDTEKIKFQIWDLAGQPRFTAVREMYYRGSTGGLLVFDVTRVPTFENTPSWVTELWKNNGKGKVPIILIGNKIDLRGGVPNSLEPTHGQALGKELSKITSNSGFQVTYLETSAKTGKNVDLAFNFLAENIMKWIQFRRGKK